MAQRLAAPALAAALCAAAPPDAQAQSDGWQFEASLCGWYPAIKGTTSFPPNGGGPSIDVSMGNVIDALKLTFQGNFEARNGRSACGPTVSRPTSAHRARSRATSPSAV